MIGKKDNKKILLISNTPVKTKSTGPAIRMINIANILSKKYDTNLYSNKTDKKQLEKYDFLTNKFWNKFISADVIYSQPSRFRYMILSRIFRKQIIIDLYDPTDIENLEMYKNSSRIKSRLIKMYSSLRLKYAIKIADYFVCSTETQRDYWIGYLQGLDKVKIMDYEEDEHLKNIIGLLPFGLESKIPQASYNPICNKYNEIKKEDKVFIWAGGIWNWFDSKNLILAMNELKNRKDIKLLFLGTPKETQKGNQKFKNAFDTIELSDKLKLTNKSVFFNNEWVDYEDRHNYLLNSYAGISLHFDNLETKYSFRTRILDYLWCDLPFIISEKDYFSEINKKKNIAINVMCNDVKSIKNAIEKLVDDKEKYNELKNNIIKEKKNYEWENVCEDLENYLESYRDKKRKKESLLYSSIFLFIVPFKLLVAIFKRG